MKTFEINKKKYSAKAFTFNMVCELEEMGISLQDASKKPMRTARAYFAICSGLDDETAGQEMEQHIINGGTFDEIIKIMADEMENSDFFRSLNKTAETENGTDKKKSEEKK